MYEIIIPDYVINDIFEIKEYIFRFSFSMETANKIYNEIMAHILNLKIIPYMYPSFKNDLRVMTVRKKYRVFYKVFENTKKVQILYIFGAEEDYESLIH